MSKRFLDDQYRLMAPGPVKISKQVREALSLPMIHHRTPAFASELENSLKLLKVFFQTKQPVMMIPSTGSGGMEAAIVNVFSPGDSVAVVVSGKFGQRWADMAKVFGLKVHVVDVPWGEAVATKEVEDLLAEHPEIRGILTQACETSTATWHPVKELAALTKDKKDVLFLVDGITAVGCASLPMDDWGIDVLVAGSQKALALPTGLSFVALSEKAWTASEKATCPKYYFDLLKEKKANEKGQTMFSSAVSHVRALNVFLNHVETRGLNNLIQRTGQLAECTRQFAVALGLGVFSKSPSPSVTAISVPDGLDGAALRQHVESKYNVTIMGGQDHLKGKIVRFGHMGDISDTDQLAALEAFALSLKDLGHPLEDTQIDGALSSAEKFLKAGSHG